MPFRIKNPNMTCMVVKLRSQTISLNSNGILGCVKGPFPDRELTDNVKSLAGRRKIIILDDSVPKEKVKPKEMTGSKTTKKKNKNLNNRGDKKDE